MGRVWVFSSDTINKWVVSGSSQNSLDTVRTRHVTRIVTSSYKDINQIQPFSTLWINKEFDQSKLFTNSKINKLSKEISHTPLNSLTNSILHCRCRFLSPRRHWREPYRSQKTLSITSIPAIIE